MPNIFNYLVSLVNHGSHHGEMLKRILHQQDLILHQQEQIMAQAADLQAKLDALNAKVAEIPGALEPIAGAIANVAADIQALKDQVGAAPVGITAEEADGFVSALDSTITNLTTAVDGIHQVGANLQAVADAQ